jgi:hypothetical protein
MKKTVTSKFQGEMRPEYDFDYNKARPNRFTGRVDQDQLVVVLDRDISQVFTTPESVTTVLRALITSMPMIKAQRGRKAITKTGQKKTAQTPHN